MRAMLVSFASYHLWLHWRLPALHLARLFTDYEPGIHYSQIQMQSGTTGINAIRIYNPIKQGFDHDPEGVFIRKWVPELRGVDRAFLHTPWLIEDLDDYPKPIVNEKISRETAAAKLYGLRKNNLLHKEIAKKIVRKHASRKASKVGLKKKSQPNGFQGELPL
jgi:deoxyribodipyrimidine photo-lyase